MAKNKNFYRPMDLRKQKNRNRAYQIKTQKVFASDEPVSEEELRQGVVIDVKVEGDKARFTIAKIYGPKCIELMHVDIDEHVAKTNGVCKWGKAGFTSFNPFAEDGIMALGESVKYAGDGALTLNYNNLARRAQLLCMAANNMSGYENATKIAENVRIIVNKFAFSVIETRGLTIKDKQDILQKSQELFSCDVAYFAQNFEDLQIFMKKCVEAHSKDSRMFGQSAYANVYE